MKNYIILLCCAVSLLLVNCSETTTTDAAIEPVDNTKEMLKSAQDLQARFVAALNSADLQAITECYWNSPDVVLYPIAGANVLRGFNAVQEEMQAFAANAGGAKLSLFNDDMSVHGDVVISHGEWKMTGTAPDGEEFEAKGRYLDIAAEKDGKWVYTLDYPSMAMPVPE